MRALIPPPVVFLVVAALMWLADRRWPAFDFELPYNTVAFWILLVAGLSVTIGGVSGIMRHRTVIHPNRRALPKATHLVTEGVFRRTRNPIYLGMATMLLAWMLHLENWLSAAGVILYVAFIDVLQIRPEEQALEGIFGEEYRKYKTKVRRWI